MNRSLVSAIRMMVAAACALAVASPTAALAATTQGADSVRSGPVSEFNKRPPARLRLAADGLAAASVGAAAADVPGTPIGVSPVAGTLTAVTDPSSVWSITLAKGDHIDVRLTVPAGCDFAPELWAPGTASVLGGTPLAGSYRGSTNERFTYVAPYAGTYYVSVFAFDGSGAFSLSYTVTAGEADDTVPGAALPENIPTHGSVLAAGDTDDVWSIACVPGRHYFLRLVADAPATGTIDAGLFGPTALDVHFEQPLQYTALLPNTEKTLRWGLPNGTAPATYYVDVRSIAGGGAYTIQYWSFPNQAVSDMPGGPLPGSFFYAPLQFSSYWDSSYGITLKANQRLTVRLDANSADVYPYILAPGTPRLTGSTPVAKSEVFGYPRLVTYTAPSNGTYLVNLFDLYGSGSVPVTIKVASAAPVTRLTGLNRFQVAVNTAKAAFPGYKGVKHVVLVSGEDVYASDPLIAEGLCGVYDAPLLLGRRASLSVETIAALKAMPKGVQVHVVGTPSAISDQLMASIRKYRNVGLVERVTPGPDRYSVAANVARRIIQVRHSLGLGDPPAVLIANGAEPAKYFDALALGPIAFRNKLPILLVTMNSVPAATAAQLTEVPYEDVVLSGGPGTISIALEAPLKVTKRWWGVDRYNTAVAVAEGAVDMNWANPSTVGVAAKVPDALTGGTLVGRTGGVMLVTASKAMPWATSTWLYTNRKFIGQGYAFGGPASITETTRVNIYNRINK